MGVCGATALIAAFGFAPRGMQAAQNRKRRSKWFGLSSNDPALRVCPKIRELGKMI